MINITFSSLLPSVVFVHPLMSQPKMDLIIYDPSCTFILSVDIISL